VGLFFNYSVSRQFLVRIYNLVCTFHQFPFYSSYKKEKKILTVHEIPFILSPKLFCIPKRDNDHQNGFLMNMPTKQECTKSTENKTPEKSSDTSWSKPHMEKSRLKKTRTKHNCHKKLISKGEGQLTLHRLTKWHLPGDFL